MGHFAQRGPGSRRPTRSGKWDDVFAELDFDEKFRRRRRRWDYEDWREELDEADEFETEFWDPEDDDRDGSG